MSEPLVSVVITSYNRFDSLQNSLKSVLEQDYENFEIFVVNDDSDDERYYEKNLNEKIKFIHIKRSETPDWGGSRQPLRNIAVKEANGKYIAFLDDDDIWMPNFSVELHFGWFEWIVLGNLNVNIENTTLVAAV